MQGHTELGEPPTEGGGPLAESALVVAAPGTRDGAIRDLGYRSYVGDRLPPSHNAKVLLRHGLRRAWGSWLVKLAAFLGWVPPLIALALVGIRYWFASGPAVGQIAPLDAASAGKILDTIYWWQIWLFVTMVTLGAGAAVIAQDLTHKSFQFYFAKPVTQAQYLMGRIGAVAIWVFLLLAVPGLLLVVAMTGTTTPELRLEVAGLFFPMMGQALLVAVVSATASVGVSSLSSSRALTMSAWILIFIVPHVLATIVYSLSDWPWLKLTSIPSLLDIMSLELFKQPAPESGGVALRWYWALPMLAAIAVGGVAMASARLRRAEVVA